MNESATSLRWLLDGLEEPLAAAWFDVRDRMRRPTSQRIMSLVDWISDPWIAKGVATVGFGLRGATPLWDPPDDVDEWPTFGIEALQAQAPRSILRTRRETVDVLISTVSKDFGKPRGGAFDEFMASEQLTSSHGDSRMIFGDQVRAWILASVGSLLRGLTFTPEDTDSERIAEATVFRLAIPSRLRLPENWELSNDFCDRYLELLLNLTVEANGELAPLDPADLRVGQGHPWRKAWTWLSKDVPAELSLGAIRLAARLLRCTGLRLGLLVSLASPGAVLRTLAAGVLRRWILTLKAMVWAEHALTLSWDLVRPADIVCLAFCTTKPEWPRRLFAVSHRSADVKPRLREMNAWRSCRYAIDATYIPGWETNTGMIWSLFATSPAIGRVRTPGYETSIWCRREAEMIQHLLDRSDYLSNRIVIDIEQDELSTLDEWSVVVPGKSGPNLSATEPTFTPSILQVWSPRPLPEWELAVLRAAGALRAMSAYLGNASLVNQTIAALAKYGDLPASLTGPTNNPGGWRPYAVAFRSIAAFVDRLYPDAIHLRLPENYTEEDVTNDRAIAEFIPDLTSGVPRLEDVLVAWEFLRTRWPIMVDQHRGRFLILNLKGVSQQEWTDDPRWSLHRGLAALRGTPVPLWFLQLESQNLSGWGIPEDPPILTEHMEAQFAWMLEMNPDPVEWRTRYPEDSGLIMSTGLLGLLRSGSVSG